MPFSCATRPREKCCSGMDDAGASTHGYNLFKESHTLLREDTQSKMVSSCQRPRWSTWQLEKPGPAVTDQLWGRGSCRDAYPMLQYLEALWCWGGKEVPCGAKSGAAARTNNTGEQVSSSTWTGASPHQGKQGKPRRITAPCPGNKQIPAEPIWRVKVSDVLQKQNATRCRIPPRAGTSHPRAKAGTREKSTPQIPLHRAENNARDLHFRHVIEIFFLLFLFLISLQAFRQLPAQCSSSPVQFTSSQLLGCPASPRHISPDEQVVHPLHPGG